MADPASAFAGVEFRNLSRDQMYATSMVSAHIVAERLRQITQEGWTPEHDDEHRRGELAMAAAYLAMSDKARPDRHCPYEAMLWPWLPARPKLKDRRRDLVRAAALILAEIERLDRAQGKAPASPEVG